MNLVVSKDVEDLASRAAAGFVRIAGDAIADRGSFTVALSGGSTPLRLYKYLVEASLDWGKVYFFFGDERNVPADEEASNFRGANKELFRPLRVREDRIFRWRTELGEPDAVAVDYERSLKRVLPSSYRFDLVLLGMGADGHTASLFPGTVALDEQERLAVSNFVPQLGAWRYTLTFPMINQARNVTFLVSGSDKADALDNVLSDEDETQLPAGHVRPVDGNLTWVVDEAAAGRLSDTAV